MSGCTTSCVTAACLALCACAGGNESASFLADSATVMPTAMSLLASYTSPDSELDAFDPVGRFRSIGSGELKDFTPFDWCSYYFALSDGIFCVRERSGEASKIRRIEQRAAHAMPWVDSLVWDGIGRTFDDRHGLLLRESFRANGIACLTFEVMSATGDSAHLDLHTDTVWSQQGSTIASGMRCRVHGRELHGMPFLADTAIYVKLWDRVRRARRFYWLVEIDYDGCGDLAVLLQRRDSVRVIASRSTGCD